MVSDESYAKAERSNRRLINAAAEKVSELVKAGHKPDEVPIIIDADEEVPFFHVLRVISALQKKGLKNNIEIVGSSRYSRFYGDFDKDNE